jgi:hypothetical protein
LACVVADRSEHQPIDWVTVEILWHRPPAEVCRSILTSYGLPTRIFGDDLGGILPHVGFGTGGLRVQVPADRAQEAKAILTESVILPGDDEFEG